MLTVEESSETENSENLLRPIQMQLSEKQKTFSKFFAPSPKRK